MEENTTVMQETKFCKECGQKIAKKAVICPHCGKSQQISMNFRDSLEHCMVPDEALKVKEVIIDGKRLKFQIPTIDYYQKVLKEFF